MLNSLMAYLSVRMEQLKPEDGQGVVEYALLAAFISIIAIVFIKAVGVDVLDIFTSVDSKLGGTNGTTTTTTTP